jgi:hypothetical protein
MTATEVKGYPTRKLKYALREDGTILEAKICEGPGPSFIEFRIYREGDSPDEQLVEDAFRMPEDALLTMACWMLEPHLGSLTTAPLSKVLGLEPSRLRIGKLNLETK